MEGESGLLNSVTSVSTYMPCACHYAYSNVGEVCEPHHYTMSNLYLSGLPSSSLLKISLNHPFAPFLSPSS